MRIFLIVAVMGLFLLAYPAPAAASTPCPANQPLGSTLACPGFTCPNLGQTQMSSDNVNIVACLQTSESNGSLVWKAMSNSPSGTQCQSCSSEGAFSYDYKNQIPLYCSNQSGNLLWNSILTPGVCATTYTLHSCYNHDCLTCTGVNCVASIPLGTARSDEFCGQNIQSCEVDLGVHSSCTTADGYYATISGSDNAAWTLNPTGGRVPVYYTTTINCVD